MTDPNNETIQLTQSLTVFPLLTSPNPSTSFTLANNNLPDVDNKNKSEGGQSSSCSPNEGNGSNDTMPVADSSEHTNLEVPDDAPHHRDRRRFRYQKDYPIQRFSRKWKRQEVQGLCCLTISVTCLVTLAVLSLQGMGYFEYLGEDGHVPHSFSWKILREFYTYEEIPGNVRECMFLLDGGTPLEKKEMRERAPGRFFRSMAVEDPDYGIADVDNELLEQELREQEQPRPRPKNFAGGNSHQNNARQCDFKKSRRSTEWLLKMFSSNFMSVLNTVTSALFLSSLSVRRKKGLQVILLIPSFLCFFMSIFQMIPTTFHYNYLNLMLRDEMRAAFTHSSAPSGVTPVLEETQIHKQCCGIEHPSTWDNGRSEGLYPGSCCNTTAYDCEGKPSIPRSQTWSVGCYQREYEHIHMYEKWSLFILAFKIIAEIGIFCAVSDLTRYEYPARENIENSRCDFRDYLIKCKGIAEIRGVTKDGRIVVAVNVFLSWRFTPSRTDMANGLLLQIKNDLNQVKGSVEIIKRLNVSTFLNEHIQVDLTRKNRGIFVFTLT